MREYALRDPEEDMIYPYGPGDPEPTLENAQKAVREAAKEFGVTLEIVWRDVTEWSTLSCNCTPGWENPTCATHGGDF